MRIRFPLAISRQWLVRKVTKYKRPVYLYNQCYSSFRKVLTMTALSFYSKGRSNDVLLEMDPLLASAQRTQDDLQTVLLLQKGE